MLAYRGFISSTGLNEISWLCYWVGFPAYLIVRISELSAEWAALIDMVAVLMIATLASILIATGITWIWRLPLRSAVAVIHSGYRGNLTFIGLPVVFWAFANSNASSEMEAAALVAFAPLVIFYNIFAVLILQLPNGVNFRSTGLNSLRGVATNPILIGVVIGLILAIVNLSLPTFLQRTLTALGQMAFPLALLSIGGALYGTRLRGNLQWAACASLIKVGLTPLMGWGIGVGMGLDADSLRLVAIFLAAPCASAGYVLVKQMNGDSGLAASAIVLSHLFALPAMLLVLLLTA